MGLVQSKRRVDDYFLSYILQRIERNKNFIMALAGPTGSGKSLAAVRLGEVLDPDFDIRNVCFTAKEFLELVDGETKKLKRGSVIVWDETQVSMSNKDFLSLQSKMINHVLETFRSDNFILFFTTPHFSLLDRTVRILTHARAETLMIDYKKKACAIKPLLIQVNQKTGEPYEKFLRVVTEQGVVPYRKMWVSLPSASLLKAYGDKKEAFNQELRRDIRRQLYRVYDEQEAKDKYGVTKPLTERQTQLVDLLKSGRTISEIAEVMQISKNSVYRNVELIKKKGVVVKPVREDTRVVRYEVEGVAG